MDFRFRFRRLVGRRFEHKLLLGRFLLLWLGRLRLLEKLRGWIVGNGHLEEIREGK